MPGWKTLAITEKSKTATTTQDGVDTVKAVEGAIGFGPYTKELETTLWCSGSTASTRPTATIRAR